MKSQWHDNWATIPNTPSGQSNGRTHGICVCDDGSVKVFHQAENGLLTYDPDGKLMSAVGGERWLGAHGLTWMKEDGVEDLWLVDELSKEVVKVTLDGEDVLRLPAPDHPVYADGGKYTPTWAAQNPINGDVWVGDGYGSSLISRYNCEGDYLESIRGTSAGDFNQPHGLNSRLTPEGDVELYVTDRANQRIKVLDGDGNLLRVSDVCHSPCCFDFHQNSVLVPELFTGVKVLDINSLELKQELGTNPDIGPNPEQKFWPPKAPKGWPNLAGTNHLKPELFNSPHGGCFDREGNVYAVEWIKGGRITKISFEN